MGVGNTLKSCKKCVASIYYSYHTATAAGTRDQSNATSPAFSPLSLPFDVHSFVVQQKVFCKYLKVYQLLFLLRNGEGMLMQREGKQRAGKRGTSPVRHLAKGESTNFIASRSGSKFKSVWYHW